MTDRAAAHFIVTGRVQGVGYRGWSVALARELGLSGWVRNRHDGTVEILAIGLAASIDLLEVACRQGPASAKVIDVARCAATDDDSVSFVERPTG